MKSTWPKDFAHGMHLRINFASSILVVGWSSCFLEVKISEEPSGTMRAPDTNSSRLSNYKSAKYVRPLTPLLLPSTMISTLIGWVTGIATLQKLFSLTNWFRSWGLFTLGGILWFWEKLHFCQS